MPYSWLFKYSQDNRSPAPWNTTSLNIGLGHHPSRGQASVKAPRRGPFRAWPLLRGELAYLANIRF